MGLLQTVVSVWDVGLNVDHTMLYSYLAVRNRPCSKGFTIENCGIHKDRIDMLEDGLREPKSGIILIRIKAVANSS